MYDLYTSKFVFKIINIFLIYHEFIECKELHNSALLSQISYLTIFATILTISKGKPFTECVL